MQSPSPRRPISVLAVLPSQEPLIDSAMATLERRPPRIPLEEAKTPPGLVLDPNFAAVPIGTGVPGEMSLEAVAPTQSRDFVVRAFVEVSDPSEVPVERDGRPLFADPLIATFPTCPNSPAVGGVPDVEARLRTAALAGRGLDGQGVAIAVLDTGINLAHLRSKLGTVPLFDAGNSWTPPRGTTAPGTYPVNHGTMCAFDALIAAPKATLLDFSILSTRVPGGAMTGSTLAVAVQAFAQLIAFWGVAFAPGGAPRYKALVVNNSWGVYHPSWDFPPGHPGRYIDNPRHPFQGLVSVLAGAGADILFAAGNCGADCPANECQGRVTGTIMGANASPDVLTLAGCDVTDTRVGYSSQGPSIAGLYQQKPDLTAYTHFLGSDAFGPGVPDNGTSAACPVAAGCVAALRTKLTPQAVPPPNLFAQLTASARQVVPSPGWNGDYGHGIIDPDAAAAGFGV
ncbi:S8/S53 family peptidase [Rhodoplanes serenus]|uniref:S8/S53 family peptidase n=1 Tax=Rhodoplanes serenus TaxID=200615 RepID=UPI00131AFA94|nr:S8/S53 family peptidase [Rhodoplanes serenus]